MNSEVLNSDEFPLALHFQYLKIDALCLNIVDISLSHGATLTRTDLQPL